MTETQRAAMQAALETLESEMTGYIQVPIRLSHAANDLRAALAEQDASWVEIGPEWTPCVKRPVTVHVRSQRVGEKHVSTREGITPVKPDDLIMRGVDGEEYPIGRDLFDRTYFVGVARIKQAAGQDAEPYLWYAEDTGDIWTPDAVAEGYAPSELIPLYTAPPRREWVSLTDEEIESLADATPVDELTALPDTWHVRMARAIEASLRAKNGGGE